MDTVVGRRNVFTSGRRCSGLSDLRLGLSGQIHILNDEHRRKQSHGSGWNAVPQSVNAMFITG